MAKVELWCGPARSERARRIDNRLRENLGHAYLVVPTRQFALDRLRDFVGRYDLGGVWGRPILTFQDFVSLLLKNTPFEQGRLEPLPQRLLLRRTIERVASLPVAKALSGALETDGFLNHAQRVIGQLKQAAVEPAAFRDLISRRRPAHRFDGAIAEIYDAYQDALRDEGVYDLQGMYWMAHEVCSQGKPGVLESADTILLDAFDDFTPSEFRLLKSLEPHLDSMVFGLNCDLSPGRRDLYGLPLHTVEKVSTSFNATPLSLESEEAETYIEFVSDHLFWRDEPRVTDGLSRNVSVHAAHDIGDEIEQIARRVKGLVLDEGASCSEIAVAFRNLAPVSGLLRDVFAEFGVPLRLHHRVAVAESPVARFVVQLYEALGEWRREAVLDLVTSPWFCTGEEQKALPMFTLLAERAGVIAGSREWSARIPRLGKRIAEGRGETIEALLWRCPEAEAGCVALERAAGRLKDIDGRLPNSASSHEHTGALLGVLDALDLKSKAREEMFGEDWNSVEKCLSTLARSGSGSKLPRDTFASLLGEAFDTEDLERAMPQYGVDCFELAGVRHLRYEHVFVGGLVEGSVPAPPPRNAIYSESDFEAMRGVGLDVGGAHEHTGRELLLFHHVFDVPRRSLTLSRHLVTGSGQATGESPFLQDVLDLLPDVSVERAQTHEATLYPSKEHIAATGDLGNLLGGGQIETDARGAGEFKQLLAGISTEQARRDSTPFGVYDGHVRADDIVQALANRYGAEHTFSASQLETYVSCPFRFFLDRVLGIDAEESPVEIFDPMLRGSILHLALESFHREHVGKPTGSIPSGEADATMAAVLEQAFEDLAWQDQSVPDGARAVEKLRLGELLARYLAIARTNGDTVWAPAHFEVGFGRAGGKNVDSLSTSEPLRVETASGTVLFSGRIDRIDFDDGKARVIDYKSTVYASTKDIKEGRSFQLAVYAFALEELLLTDRECAETLFMQIGHKKTLQGMQGRFKADTWETRREAALEAIESAVEGIRRGDFHPATTEKSCSFCPTEKICRYERGRIESKALAHE